MKRLATSALVLLVRSLALKGPYRYGNWPASQLASAVEEPPPFRIEIMYCPFWLCQNPMVAASSCPTAGLLDGGGGSVPLLPQTKPIAGGFELHDPVQSDPPPPLPPPVRTLPRPLNSGAPA